MMGSFFIKISVANMNKSIVSYLLIFSYLLHEYLRYNFILCMLPMSRVRFK